MPLTNLSIGAIDHPLDTTCQGGQAANHVRKGTRSSFAMRRIITSMIFCHHSPSTGLSATGHTFHIAETILYVVAMDSWHRLYLRWRTEL